MPIRFFSFIAGFFVLINCLSAETLFLRDNLQRAQKGDFIVISINKNDTLFHIYDKENNLMTVEEISIPHCKVKSKNFHWKEWVGQGAPGNISWVLYEIDLNTGKMIRYYSVSKNGWFDVADADHFLSKLLNLQLSKIPPHSRKHIGLKPASTSNPSRIWQPPMIIDGQLIKGVKFDAWRTVWPQDQSDLSGKQIEIYLPQDSLRYPSYFPYWLQISGTIGKAKVRIIDSGSQLSSPQPPLLTRNNPL